MATTYRDAPLRESAAKALPRISSPGARTMLERIATLPSTNTRITVTLAVFVLTALRYLSGGLDFGIFAMPAFDIDWEWLAFLGVMSGLDMAQFYAKRSTFRESPPSLPDVEDAQTGRQRTVMASQLAGSRNGEPAHEGALREASQASELS